MSTATKLNIQELAMRQIKVDHDLQARVRTEAEKVMEYATDMEGYKAAGVQFGFPPVVAFWDGKHYWLADGFHRFDAWKKVGGISIRAEIHEGTKQEAILFSVSANLKMGFRPSDDDKKKGLMMLLGIPEYRDFTNRELARRCGFGETRVGVIRREWCLAHGIDASTVRPGGPGNPDAMPCIHGNSVSINFRGSRHYVCPTSDPDRETKIARKREELLEAAVRVRRAPLKRNDAARLWFLRRGVKLNCRPKGLPGIQPDLSAPGLIIRVEAKLTPRSLPAALGDVLLWRQASDPKAAAVVVCYPDDDAKDMIRHAKALGVEFLTPHEVVERFATK